MSKNKQLTTGRRSRKRSSKPQTKAAATVTIYGPNLMTRKGRRDVSAWLRKQADILDVHGDHLGSIYKNAFRYRKPVVEE